VPLMRPGNVETWKKPTRLISASTATRAADRFVPALKLSLERMYAGTGSADGTRSQFSKRSTWMSPKNGSSCAGPVSRPNTSV
jgi:hypothetical protein